jgi:tRNA threonylcarbamoyladenosine biosynthesis protein TsaB
MKLLALDTSTEACSVALSLDGKVIERFEREPRHGERLLLMVQEVLAESGVALTQLDAIAFGRGPGSFTSLRIGAGVVQGLAFGAGLPVVPVSSLAALAQAVEAPKVLAAFDARMQQVYWGAYVRGSDGLVTLSGNEIVVDPAQVPVPPDGDWKGAGSGWDVYHTVLAQRLGEKVYGWMLQLTPHARQILQLGSAVFAAGGAVAPELALPVYLRDDVAAKARKRD